jgi:hypothetical protein
VCFLSPGNHQQSHRSSPIFDNISDHTSRQRQCQFICVRYFSNDLPECSFESHFSISADGWHWGGSRACQGARGSGFARSAIGPHTLRAPVAPTLRPHSNYHCQFEWIHFSCFWSLASIRWREMGTFCSVVWIFVEWSLDCDLKARSNLTFWYCDVLALCYFGIEIWRLKIKNKSEEDN